MGGGGGGGGGGEGLREKAGEREGGHIQRRQWRDKEHIKRRQGKKEDIIIEGDKEDRRGRRRRGALRVYGEGEKGG